MRASGILMASAVAVTLTVSIASGEYVSYISIDGRLDDWAPAMLFDDGNDVMPATEHSIDVVRYNQKFGAFYRGEEGDRDARNAIREAIFYDQRQISAYWEFAFFLLFMENPFSDTDEASVELLFSNSDLDVSAPQSERFSSAFAPTASLVITGYDGRITDVETRSWRDGEWVSTGKGEALPGIELAVHNNLLEGALKWDNLGYAFPPDPDMTHPRVILRWGTVTSLRSSHDVIGPQSQFVTTPIRGDSWGDVKAGLQGATEAGFPGKMP
jgi:hypothetical protein